MRINMLRYGFDYFIVFLVLLSMFCVEYNKAKNNTPPVYIDPPIKQTIWYC
jgi:hypothetical protein